MTESPRENVESGERLLRTLDKSRFLDTLTRRQVLRGALGGIAVIGAGGVLAACGGSHSSSEADLSGASSSPKPGGTLTVGIQTGGPGETLSIQKSYQLSDNLRVTNLYDPVNDLAEAFVPNKDATLWTLQIKDGVEFHSGKTVTADDIVYTVRGWGDKANYGSEILINLIDFQGVRKRDSRTVEIPLLIPVAELPSFVGDSYWYGVIPDGVSDEQLTKSPDGTGPFKFVSFTPGKTSTFDRFENYHVSGLPYLDSLIVDSSFTDDTARTNALASGGIQVAPQLPYTLGANPPSTFKVNVVAKAGNINPFFMHVDTAPFDDARVRQAIRLSIDRTVWNESIYSGLGTAGNDVPIPFTTGFDPSLARERDLEQAKALLKAADAEALSFTVTTSNGFAGMVESATLLQQQLKDAGIKVNLDQVDQSQYWVNFLRYPFGQGVWWGYEALAPFYLAALTTTSPYRETRFGTEATDQLIYDAVGELDKAKSQDKWNAIQQQQFEEGGYVIPATFPFVDAMARNVVVQTSTLGFINNYRLGDAYFTS